MSLKEETDDLLLVMVTYFLATPGQRAEQEPGVQAAIKKAGELGVIKDPGPLTGAKRGEMLVLDAYMAAQGVVDLG